MTPEEALKEKLNTEALTEKQYDAILEAIESYHAAQLSGAIKAKIYKSKKTGNRLTTDCLMISDLDYSAEQCSYIKENAEPINILIIVKP